MAILGCFRQFWDKKRANPFGFALFGRGMRTCLAICKAEPRRSQALPARLIGFFESLISFKKEKQTP